MGKYGYDFYFKIGEEVLTLPITPSSMKMTIGSNNKVVTLISEGDINLLKSPSLVEFKFDARFPMRPYPYSREALNFETYMNKFTALKTDKKPFVFNVVRTTPDGKGTWATVRRVTLEDLEVNEDADEGDDVIVSFELKEYKEYGVVTHKQSTSTDTTSTSDKARPTDNKAKEPVMYTIKSGDTLWGIAKAFYGNGAKWTIIYEANKAIINEDARKHGRNDSSNGHWIYPNLQIVIPAVDGASNVGTASKSGSKSGSKGGSTNYGAVGVLADKHTLTINCNGIHAYTGTLEVIYTLNGAVKRHVSETKFEKITLSMDTGTSVEVRATPLTTEVINHGVGTLSSSTSRATSDYGVTFSLPKGQWTSHGTYQGFSFGLVSVPTHYRKCDKVNGDLEVTVKWIKKHQNLSMGEW